jgi:hypothetical protein
MLCTHYPKNDDCEQEGSSHIWVNTIYGKTQMDFIYNTYTPYAEVA